ncbi:MAG: ABC transporter substrate-binding protein [Chloroflexi bacterium]|nr:ABC transporter substrate-binding protein [Chloroflexota bacterium]
MKSRFWLAVFTLMIAASLVLSACQPQATPTAEAPTQAPPAAAPTTPPSAPTTAPVAAPTTAPAVSPTTAAAPKTGGRITYIDISGYYSPDPYLTPWYTLSYTAMYDTLVVTNLEYNGYVGVLAKSWDISPDGLTVTFHLRDDVKFTDGTPFNAEAAKWNLDNWLDPNFNVASRSNWVTHTAEIQAPDATTLIFKLKDAYAPLFSDLTATYFVSPTAYKTLGQDNFGTAPVGTGPWIAKEVVPNDHILYVRNPDYKWGPSYYTNTGAPYPDEFYVKLGSDEQTAYAALETGEADIIALPTQYLEQAQGNPDLVVNKGLDSATNYLGFNDKVAPFTDLNFRLAIAYAVNRDEIIQAAFGGAAFPLYSALGPSALQYNDAQNEYAKNAQPYDPAKATELLTGLGYTPGSDGILVGKDGKQLDLTLNFPATDDAYKRAAETIQSELADIGVKVELGPMEAAAIAEMLNGCKQQMFMRAYGLPDAGIISSVFDTAKMGSGNRNCWSDPKTDELIKTADTTMDPTARGQAVDALVNYLTDQRPHVPLWANYLYTAYRSTLKGLKFDKPGGFFLNDAYVDK